MDPDSLRGKWPTLLLLAVGELLAMGLWFSGSAVVPQLTEAWSLGDEGRAWMTMIVQIGFVVGALFSAVLNLADRISAQWLVSACALIGGLSTAAIALFAEGQASALVLRFVTGVALAGVYPPAMKLVATWCKVDRGFGIGLLVGALTLGSGLPHLLNAWSPEGAEGMPPWRTVLLVAAGLAALGGLIVAIGVRPGPFLGKAAPFDWRFAGEVFRNRSTRLANFGYLGHQWELYAMWTWVPILLLASYQAAGWSAQGARLAGFGTLAAGALGCVVAGKVADRVGRTVVATASLAVSGVCCLVVGLCFDMPGVLTALCLVWGFAVVADSAQFSASISELTDPRYVGTALTVQTCVGFLLTIVSIRTVPLLVSWIGWEWVFTTLAIGPAFGIWAMLKLRGLPEAKKMASGMR